ncbi:MAG: hypothetical protein ACRCWS_05050 [Propionibacteriaceae bacterium]
MESMTAHNARQHFGDDLPLFDLGHRDNHRIVEAATGLLIADPSTGSGGACSLLVPSSSRRLTD